MDSKLTLKLNGHIIERAKKYAANNNISLSRLIENYLNSLTNDRNDEVVISPFVKSISSGKSIPLDAEKSSPRHEYFDEKYK